MERYQAFRSANPKATIAERSAAMERIAIEEGELPPRSAQYFVSRLRSSRDVSEIGSFIDDARRIVRLADAIPHAIGREGIPNETLLIARKIIEAAYLNPEEAQRNPRKIILAGIEAAGDEAFDQGTGIDPAVALAVGLTIEPLRRRGAPTASAAILGSTGGAIRRVTQTGGSLPHMIDRKGTDRFVRQLQKALSGSGYELRFRQYERKLADEHQVRRFMDVHAIDPRTNSQVMLRYEVKTNDGKLTKHQRDADAKLEKMGFKVNYVNVDLSKGTMDINGRNAQKHFGELRRMVRQR